MQISGFTVHHSLRHDYPPNSTRSFGGILVYVKKTIPHSVIFDNSGNNLYQLGINISPPVSPFDLSLVFVYMPHANANMLHYMTIDPWDALHGKLSMLQGQGTTFLAIGDFNAHCSNLNAPSSGIPRVSPDPKLDNYGLALLDVCSHTNACIVNGTFDNYSGHTYVADTSHSVSNDSVIDYCISSVSVIKSISLSIGHVLFSSDHLPLIVSIDLSFVFSSARRRSRSFTNPFVHSSIPPIVLDRPRLPKARAFHIDSVPKGPPLGIQPLTAFHDTPSCASIRKAMTSLAKSPGFAIDSVAKNKHKSLNRQLVTLRARIKHSRLKSVRDSLLGVQGRKEYWDFVQGIRGKRKAVDGFDPVAAHSHFRSLLDDGDYYEDDEASFLYTPDEAVDSLDTPFDKHDVESALKKMKNSALGEDRVSVHALRALESVDIAKYFNSLTDSALPEDWYRSILIPIPKPGLSANQPSDLRGLSLQTAVRRLYTRCLVPRLTR